MVQNDAKSAVVSVGIDGVNVPYLDYRDERKQRQAHQDNCRIGSGPRAAVATHPCVKSSQT